MSSIETRDAARETRSGFEALNALRQRLADTRLHDRARLARELDRLFARRERGNFNEAVASLSNAIDASAAKVAALRSLPLKLHYDPALPIAAHREAILKTLNERQVLVLCGATGSGKTTQLPKFCLEAGRGALGLIGHTQPRRIAARAIAARLASELGTTVGGAVGYQVRFNDRVGPDCRVKLMTDGILLKELESDRNLSRYDTLIIDEAHERSLNIDLLLGVLKRVLAHRPELKLIVTSATIDPQRFSEFFGGAPIIEVSGRSYPVEVRYRPLLVEDDEAAELSLPEGVVEAVKELDSSARGDVLVFLPGEKQIRECTDALVRAKLHHTEVLPLYSRLSTRDQERIFEGHAQRRIVLATNVAETSLTVPGIRYVVDSGLARISRYSVRGKVQRLPIEKISRASADQRKGRCGREAEGICIRLFGEDDFNLRDEFTPPEVLRTNLASVILRLAVLGLGEPGDFPFIDPPDTRLINDGYRLLQELKAVNDDRRVTALGRQIAALPIDPRLARMLIAASHHACLAEMLVLAAFLEIQDPRERPADAQAQADQAHATFADPRSDFIAVLNLWKAYQEQAAMLSGSQLRKWCREHFLSFVRMREWEELHRQLSEAVDELELRANTQAAEYAELHQAILTGFLGQIGSLDEKREYLGARGSRFVIAPGTPLASKPPKWVVAGSVVETARVFARMVASVEPHWIERAGEHLLKRSYAEPHWVEHKGFVAALESVSLYGLTLVGQRRVNFGSVDAKAAQQIFVREALVEGRATLRAAFVRHNAQLRAQVEAMEAKIRRRDVVVDEQALCDFYVERLPPHVNSVAAMEKWLKSKEDSAKHLFMSLHDLMRRDTPEITAEQFPDSIEIDGNVLQLCYRFEPGAEDDGVTAIVPQPLLATLSADRLAWVVPGWRVEKITALLRALPKDQRKHFVPVPEAAAKCARELDNSLSNAAFAEWVSRESAMPIAAEQIAQLPLPDHLRTNVRVVKLDGGFIAQGRDLVAMRRTARAHEHSPVPSELHRAWDFGDLPVERTIERRGVRFVVYPAIEDRSNGVALIECGTLQAADVKMRRGLLRLAVLGLAQQAKFVQQQFKDQRELVLSSQGFADPRELVGDFVDRVFETSLFAGETLPRSREAFERWLNASRSNINDASTRVLGQCVEMFRSIRAIRQSLAALQGAPYQAARADIQQQLEALVPPRFLAITPQEWFPHVPRYLRALQRRVEKLPGNIKRDAELMTRLAPFANAVKELSGRSNQQHEWQKLRWMLEEFRVSLFAQDLKTVVPVSDKRLAEQVQLARGEARR